MLPVAALFLMVLAVLGLGSMQLAGFAEKITGVHADRQRAFVAAEAALRDATQDLYGLRVDGAICPVGTTRCRGAGERPIAGPAGAGLTAFAEDCTAGQCLPASTSAIPALSGTTPLWRDLELFEQRSVEYGRYTSAAPLPDVARQPRYLIEGFRRTGSYLFRITGVGYGMRPSMKVTLQAVVQVKA